MLRHEKRSALQADVWSASSAGSTPDRIMHGCTARLRAGSEKCTARTRPLRSWVGLLVIFIDGERARLDHVEAATGLALCHHRLPLRYTLRFHGHYHGVKRLLLERLEKNVLTHRRTDARLWMGGAGRLAKACEEERGGSGARECQRVASRASDEVMPGLGVAEGTAETDTEAAAVHGARLTGAGGGYRMQALSAMLVHFGVARRGVENGRKPCWPCPCTLGWGAMG